MSIFFLSNLSGLFFRRISENGGEFQRIGEGIENMLENYLIINKLKKILIVLCFFMKILIKKDGDWYLVEVDGKKNIFAFWYTEEEAINELKNVIDMMTDYYNEELQNQKILKHLLLERKYSYAI